VPGSGDKYLALFNIGENRNENIVVDLTELGYKEPVSIRDLWAKTDLGEFSGEFSVTVEPHGAGLYKISAE